MPADKHKPREINKLYQLKEKEKKKKIQKEDVLKTSAKPVASTRKPQLTLADWLLVYAWVDAHPAVRQADVVQHFETHAEGALEFMQSMLSLKLTNRPAMEKHIESKARGDLVVSRFWRDLGLFPTLCIMKKSTVHSAELTRFPKGANVTGLDDLTLKIFGLVNWGTLTTKCMRCDVIWEEEPGFKGSQTVTVDKQLKARFGWEQNNYMPYEGWFTAKTNTSPLASLSRTEVYGIMTELKQELKRWMKDCYIQ
ncbi:hypothetical protein B0H17DRAFT_1131909 [Mycena rosella]|uniref:Uncharacterized protein n=1 Tax=Mycena rosella TaxID=1033263 RepID=A0AAD7GLF3_MYCRO|nr:hypothetical protein B0H17DRAFT_1131909 [Mycena rosella]